VTATNATAVTIAGSDNSNYTLANTGGNPDRKADVGQHNLHRNGGWRDEYRNGHNECHGDIGPAATVYDQRESYVCFAWKFSSL